jgi:hypothetical protein
MAEHVDDDLRGSRFERVDLSGSEWVGVKLNDARMRRVNLSGIDLRSAAIYGGRLLGIELKGVEITGEIIDVTINGVEIGPLIEAELNRRDPDRVKLRPQDADGYRDAWAMVCRRWDTTIERARGLPPAVLHEHVAGEWSFVQTIRHLNFAIAAWVGRMLLGDPSPWHPLDLPWDEAPGWDGIPWDRVATPALEEVLPVWQARRAMVDEVMRDLTDERLAATVSMSAPGWPSYDDVPVMECLLVVLIEMWEHRNYAERDLDLLSA